MRIPLRSGMYVKLKHDEVPDPQPAIPSYRA
jgi:hypothetical protein